MLRNELLEREAFDTLLEAKLLIERWRQHNTIRPHSALGYRPPAPPGVAAPCKPKAEDAGLEIRPQFFLHMCWNGPPLKPALEQLADDLVKRRVLRPPREWTAGANG